MTYQPPPPPRAKNPSNPFDAGIFKALIDFSFVSFATPKLIRILYMMSFLGIALVALAAFVSGLASGEPLVILLALIVVPVVTILMLVYVRVVIELLAVLFRIGDNTTQMVAALHAAQPDQVARSPSAAAPVWSTAPAPVPGSVTNV